MELGIVEELNRQGVPPPGVFYKRKSAQPPTWCASALYGNPKFWLGMLNNRRYLGEVTWGLARWPKDPDTKKKQRMLCAEEDWLTQPPEHLRIIEDPLWARVKRRQQDVQKGSAAIRTALHANVRTRRGPKYLFSSLLMCAQCGHKFIIVDPGTTDVAGGSHVGCPSAPIRLSSRGPSWSRSCWRRSKRTSSLQKARPYSSRKRRSS